MPQDIHYHMPPNKELAIQLAKRHLAEFVYDAVNLEGINLSLPEVQTLLDGITVGGHKIEDQEIALNQIRAWRLLFSWVEAVQIICGRDDFEFHDSLADCYAVLEILKVMGNSAEVNGEHRWSDIFDRVFGGKSPGMHIHSRRMFMSELSILKGYQPGSIGRIAELHGRYYSANWGFGSFFESKVARELADFVDRYDSEGDGFWIATANGRIEGSIVIDGLEAQSKGAHLRWFIVSDAYRLQGLGNRLMKTAMEFCDAKKYDVTYLWTFEGLDPARHLYEKSGFELIRQDSGRQWGTEVNEQYFERRKQTGA